MDHCPHALDLRMAKQGLKRPSVHGLSTKIGNELVRAESLRPTSRQEESCDSHGVN